MCLAKANSAPSLDVVVVQDLTLGEGQGVENGDSLEVAYTGWLLQNHAIGQVVHRRVCCVPSLFLGLLYKLALTGSVLFLQFQTIVSGL